MENKKFKAAVEATQEIREGYCNGLQALGGNAAKVAVTDTRKLNGSVDIDACTLELYPNETRWDYAIGYDEKAYFLEVHPANTSNVKEMIQKADWLKQWLQRKASDTIIDGCVLETSYMAIFRSPFSASFEARMLAAFSVPPYTEA